MSIDLKKLLLYATLFIAPAGMFYTPVAAVGSFRLFYFGCLVINLYSIVRLRRGQLQHLSILIFIFALIMASAGYGLMAFRPEIVGAAHNPVVRALVIGNLMFGFYFIGRLITELSYEEDVITILDKSFFGFVAVFLLGFLLYLMVLRGLVPASVYKHFVSLEQSGYGYLRLSPGTYPNEFGVLCSFFAVYALIKYAYESVRWPIVLAFFFVIGMFLTSTRAAYVTFFAGVLTLFTLHHSLRFKAKLILLALCGAAIVIGGLRLIGFDVVHVFVSGYNAAFNMQSGSTATRAEAWTAAIDYFPRVPGLGVGFESPAASFLHNLPLQLLYGLGIWGLTLLIGLFGLFFSSLNQSKSAAAPQEPLAIAQFRMIRLVLLEHVVLFGLTNHNQAHFLTWLLFALFICNVRAQSNSDLDSKEETLDAAFPNTAGRVEPSPAQAFN